MWKRASFERTEEKVINLSTQSCCQLQLKYQQTSRTFENSLPCSKIQISVIETHCQTDCGVSEILKQ